MVASQDVKRLDLPRGWHRDMGAGGNPSEPTQAWPWVQLSRFALAKRGGDVAKRRVAMWYLRAGVDPASAPRSGSQGMSHSGSVGCSALSQRLRNLDVDRFQAGA